MAQIGSFVPATQASFSIRHQLFARLSLDDSVTSNMSSFAAEMRETAFILRNVDHRTLVIIDELGRGTSSRDGLAIAIAIAEALIQSKATAWFVTHFPEAAKFLFDCHGVVNLHLSAQLEDQITMKMLYKVAQGPVQEQHYGIALAKVVGLPFDILEIAKEISCSIQASGCNNQENPHAVLRYRKEKLFLSLSEHLVHVKEGSLRGPMLRAYLKKLQDEFVCRFSELEDEERRLWLFGTSQSNVTEDLTQPSYAAEESSCIKSSPSTDLRGKAAVDAITVSSSVESVDATSVVAPDEGSLVRSPLGHARQRTSDLRYTMVGAL